MTGFTEAERATLRNRPRACRPTTGWRREARDHEAGATATASAPSRGGSALPRHRRTVPVGAKFNDIKGEVHVHDAPERSRGLGI